MANAILFKLRLHLINFVWCKNSQLLTARLIKDGKPKWLNGGKDDFHRQRGSDNQVCIVANLDSGNFVEWSSSELK